MFKPGMTVPASDWSFVMRRLIEEAVNLEPGQLWTYEQMSAAAGREIRGSEPRWQKAKNRLANDHGVELNNVKGVGYVRLDDQGIVEKGPSDRRKIQRTVHKAKRRVSNIRNFEALPDHAKKEANLQHAILGAMSLVTKPKTVRTITDRLESSAVSIDKDAVLRLFRAKTKEGDKT